MPGSTTNIPARIDSGSWSIPSSWLSRSGLPSAVWCLLGLLSPRKVPIACWATLLVLALGQPDRPQHGRSRAVVDALHAAASGSPRGRLRAAGSQQSACALGGSIALLGLQTLGLQSMIQVVYPV